MLEMHKIARYEYALVLRFGRGFVAEGDATELANWLERFCKEKGRPPTRLSFTFHADDGDAESVCQFMRACVSLPAVALLLSQMRVELVFAGGMSRAVVAETHDRILSQRF